NCHEDSPKSDHSRTYTVLPLVGNPLTVPDRFISCGWAYTSPLPAPLVPTVSQYCVAPTPAVQAKVTTAPGKEEPGAGLVSTAGLAVAAVYVSSLNSHDVPPTTVHSRTYTAFPSVGSQFPIPA